MLKRTTSPEAEEEMLAEHSISDDISGPHHMVHVQASGADVVVALAMSALSYDGQYLAANAVAAAAVVNANKRMAPSTSTEPSHKTGAPPNKQQRTNYKLPENKKRLDDAVKEILDENPQRCPGLKPKCQQLAAKYNVPPNTIRDNYLRLTGHLHAKKRDRAVNDAPTKVALPTAPAPAVLSALAAPSTPAAAFATAPTPAPTPAPAPAPASTPAAAEHDDASKYSECSHTSL